MSMLGSGCDHVLWLAPCCHPDAPVKVGMFPGHDHALVICSVCHATVQVIQMAHPCAADAKCPRYPECIGEGSAADERCPSSDAGKGTVH